MAKFLITVLALLFVVTAGSAVLAQQDFEQLIAGKWRADPAETRTYLKLPRLATDADEDFLKVVSNLTIEFGNDRSVRVYEGDKEQMAGTWELVKEEDSQVTINLIREDEATPTTVTLLAADSVAIKTQNERSIVFTRAAKHSIQGIAAKLIGTWECDREATLSLESNKAFTQQQVDDMLAEAASMVVSFNADASFTALTQAGTETMQIDGTWSVDNENLTQQTFQLKLEASRGPKIVQVELRDDGKVIFSPEGQPAAVFVPKPDTTPKVR